MIAENLTGIEKSDMDLWKIADDARQVWASFK